MPNDDDDLHSASDGIFSLIAGRLRQANVISEYCLALSMPMLIDKIPQVNIPAQIARVSVTDLLSLVTSLRVLEPQQALSYLTLVN